MGHRELHPRRGHRTSGRGIHRAWRGLSEMDPVRHRRVAPVRDILKLIAESDLVHHPSTRRRKRHGLAVGRQPEIAPHRARRIEAHHDKPPCGYHRITLYRHPLAFCGGLVRKQPACHVNRIITGVGQLDPVRTVLRSCKNLIDAQPFRRRQGRGAPILRQRQVFVAYPERHRSRRKEIPVIRHKPHCHPCAARHSI